MDHPDRRIQIDQRIEVYQDYLSSEWAENILAAANPSATLDKMVLDLLLAWRTVGYTACMPANSIQAMRSALIGYSHRSSSDANILAFGENVIAFVSRKIPELVDDRRLRSRLIAELTTEADRFREVREKECKDIPVQPLWEDFLTTPAFHLSVWSSQRLAYVGFFNAYEAFLVRCVKHAAQAVSLKTSEAKKFYEAVRKEFGDRVLDTCWLNNGLQADRHVRHALTHANGEETEKLKEHKHGILVLDGVLQVFPDDNKGMLGRLQAGVEVIVSAAIVHPRFK